MPGYLNVHFWRIQLFSISQKKDRVRVEEAHKGRRG